MQEILEAYPGAQRALFSRYHIGGCSSCGFAPTDTLEAVLKNHDVEDALGALSYIKESQEADRGLQMSARELEAELKSGKVKLVDVRTAEERALVHMDNDLFATEELAHEILNQWPKDTPIVLYCHHGERSLEAAKYLSSQGFAQVKSLQGGIDAWSQEVDSLLPRY